MLLIALAVLTHRLVTLTAPQATELLREWQQTSPASTHIARCLAYIDDHAPTRGCVALVDRETTITAIAGIQIHMPPELVCVAANDDHSASRLVAHLSAATNVKPALSLPARWKVAYAFYSCQA